MRSGLAALVAGVSLLAAASAQAPRGDESEAPPAVQPPQGEAAREGAAPVRAAVASEDGALLAPSLESPRLGVPATAEQVAGWDITVAPDGSGLPPGSATAADGEEIYQQKCLACHGGEGTGGPNDRLAGGHGSIGAEAPVKTIGSYWPYATTVFDYIRRAMPYAEPQSLSSDEAYALTAYLLHLNGIVAEGEVISAETLPRIVMPNQDNFIIAYPGPQRDQPRP